MYEKRQIIQLNESRM